MAETAQERQPRTEQHDPETHALALALAWVLQSTEITATDAHGALVHVTWKGIDWHSLASRVREETAFWRSQQHGLQ